MVSIVNRYRVKCITTGTYEFVWAEQEPTTCPVNETHTIDPLQTVIVDSIEETFPVSTIDGKRIAVHPSYKPSVDGNDTYAVWAGSGDEVDVNGDLIPGGILGGGPIVHLNMTTSDTEVHVDVKFNPDNGKVWLHEAYIKFIGAPEKAFLNGEIHAEATPLQPSVNLDLEVANNWIKLAAGGPGTGSFGWADANKIVLIPRSFSKDGDWDYDGINLTPNTTGTGGYKISDIERIVHRYVNRIPCYQDCSTYFSITSDETTELPKNYFLRISSGTTDGLAFTSAWHASVIIEIYRERTYIP